MPHQSFGTVRQASTREPITFDFGIYNEETFTVVPEPSLGDTFDLYDAPEPNPENMLETVRVLATFIRRMLKPEDRDRFNRTLKDIPASHGHLIVEAAAWIASQITPFESPPAESSSGGQQRRGKNFKTLLDGTRG